ncbi:NIPSNAP family protein [Paludisphaera mucosa]|uniref:NIPSNAP family protein n=1 Tax=Paludisphaera mucosa TaxID=3030827 RepID=A0ABT6FDF0_9BACT|nr:NIPSNAP family protein [Paludisphaera mucosa]MDG3005567.1 NIPSNAP family protein [Paludisphaera mucosa]
MRLALTVGLLLFGMTLPVLAADDKPSRVFELRTYHTPDGKLVDLHKRFRDHTCALLKKHGAELVGFWTPQDEKDGKAKTLIYLVAYPSREAATQTWKAFQADPEWQKAKAASEVDGKLTEKVDSVFLEPTDYSAMK